MRLLRLILFLKCWMLCRSWTFGYEITLFQFICSGTDLFITIISPVLLAKFWVVYSIGIMPFGIPVKMAFVNNNYLLFFYFIFFQLTYVFLIIEIVIAYAACVLYCHKVRECFDFWSELPNLQAILPPDSPLRLHRWFHPFIALLNAWLLIFLPCVYYAISELEYTEDVVCDTYPMEHFTFFQEIPFELRWIISKKVYYVFHWDEDSVWILIGGLSSSTFQRLQKTKRYYPLTLSHRVQRTDSLNFFHAHFLLHCSGIFFCYCAVIFVQK